MAYKSFPEIKVISMEVSGKIEDIGAAVSKAMPPGRRYRYSHDVTYKLKDGTELPGCIYGLTKPKLSDRVESTKNNIALGCMFANKVDNDGEVYWCYTVKYYIGPRSVAS